MTPKIITILGTSYCGSTILTRLMDVIPSVQSVGEMHWVVDTTDEKFQEIFPYGADNLEKFQRPVCLWAVRKKVKCGEIDAEDLYEATRTQLGAGTIVTSDKNEGNIRRLSRQNTVHGLFTWKRPEAMLASYRRHGSYEIDTFVDFYRGLLRWAPSHLAGWQSVYYEDVVKRPFATLCAISKAFDLEKPSRESVDTALSREYTQIGGNEVASVARSLYFDERWRTELSSEDIEAIENDESVQEVVSQLQAIRILARGSTAD